MAARAKSRSSGGASRPKSIGTATSFQAVISDPAAAKDAVVLSRNDLLNLTARLQTTSLQTTSRVPDPVRAQERKQRMLEMDAKYKRDPQSLEEQAHERRQRDLLLSRAKQAMDAEHDDVKHMNQIVQYAKTVAVRDRQITEKKEIMAEEAEEERLLALAMEAERLKFLKAQEEAERARREDQRGSALVLKQQIAERETERMRVQEQKEQEAQAMLQRIKETEEREEAERQAKVVAGRKLLAQVMKDNNAQARAKLRKKQEELDEDRKIADYVKNKEAREAEVEADQNRIKAEKEKEVARLRAMQERAQDRQSAVDELRAKRYHEAKERAWRQDQLEQATKRDNLKREMQAAREAQRGEKSRMLVEQALAEREEFNRVLEHQITQADSEAAKDMEAREERRKHREQLLEQIAARQAAKHAARDKALREGKGFSGNTEAERRRLEKIKQEKLEELVRAGVPEKYMTELTRKKVLVASIHT